METLVDDWKKRMILLVYLHSLATQPSIVVDSAFDERYVASYRLVSASSTLQTDGSAP
jgi:hypothetical protein